MQGDIGKISSQTDIEIYMIHVSRILEKSMALGSNSSESSFGHIAPQRFYAEVTYDEYTSEYRYLSTGDVQLWDKRNIILHEATKECYMFHETAGHLVTIGIETCPAEIRFLLCRDKVMKQHRSQLYPELINMSRSKALRLTLPCTSIIGIT